MSDITFLRTRHEYGSYVDWFKLVELSGYPVVYFDELPQHDAPDKTFIGTPINGEWNHWTKADVQGRLILYQLEWNVDGKHNTPAAVSEVWCGDKWAAETSGFKYVPLGSDCGLNPFSVVQDAIDKEYDVSMLSYQTNRRQHITNELYKGGVTYPNPQGLWGYDRSKTLMQSRLMLHVHQFDNMPTIAPLRWCLAAAHHLPMISERVSDRGIFGYTHMMTSDYAHLPAFVAHMLKDPRTLEDQAAALHNLLCHEYTFKTMVQLHV